MKELRMARTRRRYTVEEKLKIVEVARMQSYAAARALFGASRSSIHEWFKLEATLVRLPPSSKRSKQGKVPGSENASIEHVSPTDIPMTQTPPLPNPPTPPSKSIVRSQPVLAIEEQHVESMAASNDAASPQDLSAIASSQQPTALETTANQIRRGEPHLLVSSQIIEYESSDDEDNSDGPMANVSLLIGYTGEKGGFTEIAARRVFDALDTLDRSSDSTFQLTGYPQVAHMLEALGHREIDYAFVATETLLSSTYRAALDRVVAMRFGMIGEVTSEEIVSVCALPGVQLHDADCIMSDWQLLSRYEEYILRLENETNQFIHRQVSWDSATACRIIQEEQDFNTLVLCSKKAAHANGLDVIQHRVPNGVAHTKYTIIGRRGTVALPLDILSAQDNPGRNRQATLLVDSADQADLLNIVSAFARLNLKIEHFSVHDHSHGFDRPGQTCVVSYRSSNAVVEATLNHTLTALATRVIHFGNYFTYNVDGLE